MASRTMFLRILLYLGGFATFSLGTALSITSTLGVTATTSLPLALGCISGASVGLMMTAMAVVYVLGQLILLGKDFPLLTIGQVGTGLLMGFLVDRITAGISYFAPTCYPEKLLLALIGLPFISLGLSMIINANFLPTPSEGFSLALARKLGKPFPRVKVLVDCITLLLAIGLLLAFSRPIVGIREGTALNAVAIGFLIGFFNRRLEPLYRFINEGGALSFKRRHPGRPLDR